MAPSGLARRTCSWSITLRWRLPAEVLAMEREKADPCTGVARWELAGPHIAAAGLGSAGRYTA